MSHLIRWVLFAPLMADPAWSAAPDAVQDGGLPSSVASSAATPAGEPAFPVRFAPTGRLAEADKNRAPAVVPGADPPTVEPLPLPPRGRSSRANESPTKPPSAGGALTTVVGSLGVVLAVFFLFVWVSRRSGAKGLILLPGEVVESLGRARLAGRQHMQLLRVGRKLVLLSVTSTDARTLTEITDPVEVDRLAGLCQQNRSGSITAAFRQVLGQCAGEPSLPDSYRSAVSPPTDRSRSSASRRGSLEDSHG